MPHDNDITYFAKLNYRNWGTPFGIRQEDRLMHTYIIGKTGTGKSTLIRTMIMQDIQAGRGVCLLDPHGDLVQSVHDSISVERKKDVLYFNVPDRTLTLKYNPFKKVSYEKRSLVASGILDVFKKLWADAWGVKLEHILRHAILTLLDQPQATIADIPKLLLDRSYRYEAIKAVKNESVKSFWQKEFGNYNRYDLLPVLNKIGGMLAHPVIKRVLIENSDEVSLRKAMDEKKIILVNLAKGHIGEDAAHILGALFISSISAAAFSRVDTQEDSRVPYMVYMDEFHNFTTLSLVNMFSELRKFKVGMTLAHQYFFQLDDEIRRAILGNAGTIIAFRVGTEDSLFLSKEMFPEFGIEDFINLPNYYIYLKLMINGAPSRPFSGISVQHKELFKQP
ncbi:MAG: type IV secretion system DNA-binding domain-containing protein [Bacteroidetes bacterium]|nr:type IV secretion system DNA-binding domain-containing protein [Bacteroidota bacterium]